MNENLSILEVLAESHHLLMSEDSRGYTWALEQNKAFLNDVLHLAENKGAKHSFGLISLLETDEESVYTVIDGMQRLICVSVLLAVAAAFSERVSESKDSPKSKIQRLFLANFDIIDVPHVKIVLNDFDAVTYKNILLDRVNYTNHASKSILNLYMFFLGQMAIKKLTPSAIVEALSRFEVTRLINKRLENAA